MEKYVASCLEQLKNIFIQNVQENLVGIYLHGSITYECFNPKFSDIDLLIVVKEKMTKKQKAELIKDLVNIWAILPKKGLEFSIVLEANCSNLHYPVPYELHFSQMWLECYRKNIDVIINDQIKYDWDLVTYFQLILSRGKVLYGKPSEAVFAPVPNEAYVRSICLDLKGSHNDLEKDSASVILNQCRILAFLYEEKILSKKEAGEWCIEKRLVADDSGIVRNLQIYRSNQRTKVSPEEDGALYQQLYQKIKMALSENAAYKKILAEVLT